MYVHVHRRTCTYGRVCVGGSPVGRSACQASGRDNPVQDRHPRSLNLHGASFHQESRKAPINHTEPSITHSSAGRKGQMSDQEAWRRGGVEAWRLRWDCNINPRESLNEPLKWSSSAKEFRNGCILDACKDQGWAIVHPVDKYRRQSILLFRTHSS